MDENVITVEMVDGDHHAKIAVDRAFLRPDIQADVGATVFKLLARIIRVEKEKEL